MTNIASQILDDPEGGTVSLAGDPLPTVGYFVGGVVTPLILDTPSQHPRWDREAMDGFIEYLNSPAVGALYLGWWTDEETGTLWVDGTTWHADYDEAERTTRERGEIAFWDIERQREFRPVQV
jgi:hypothetical protein